MRNRARSTVCACRHARNKGWPQYRINAASAGNAGDRDKTVHPRNSEQVVSQSLERNDASSADASTQRGQVPGGHAYTRTIHRDATGRVVLEHWLVHGGGHAWFGGSPQGSYVDPKGPDAAREMIRFFYQNTLEQRS